MKYLMVCVVLIMTCCKTAKLLTAQPLTAPSSGSPMSCSIEGRIMSEARVHTEDTTAICAKYPCQARVLILNVSGCGSSVSASINAADTLTIYFAYTLHSTAKIFPAMGKHYPGLKMGDKFKADVFEHLQPGTDASLTIYDYQVEK